MGVPLLVLGYQHLDFEGENGRVKGTNLFFAYEDDGVIGQRVDKVFLDPDFKLPDLQPGMTLDATFNRRGRLVKIAAAPANQRLNLGKQ